MNRSNNDHSETHAPNDSLIVDLFFLGSRLFRYRMLIFVATLLGGMLAYSYARTLPDYFESRAVVAASGESVGGASALPGQLDGLASLAGLNLSGSKGATRIAIAKEKLKSHTFFVRNLLPEIGADLIAFKEWDGVSLKNIYDENLLGPSMLEGKSIQDLHGGFLSLLNIQPGLEPGMFVISVRHQSPQTAQKILELALRELNSEMKKKDLSEAKRIIAYLTMRQAESEILVIKEVLAGLLEENLKTIVLANGVDNYVFDILDPPLVPEKKAGPARGQLVLLGSIAGFVLGISIAFSAHLISLASLTQSAGGK